MTTHTPRAPYSPEELATLYPSQLELQQVQVILRHGERTPVNARFKNVSFSYSLFFFLSGNID
jgi:acid phosphatase